MISIGEFIPPSAALHWAYRPRSQKAIDLVFDGAAARLPEMMRAREHLIDSGIASVAGLALQLWLVCEFVPAAARSGVNTNSSVAVMAAESKENGGWRGKI